MMGIEQGTSPTRLLEMLSDRFGAFEAIANSSIKLARVAPEEELAMEPLVAEAILEFGEDLCTATIAVTESARANAAIAAPVRSSERSCPCAQNAAGSLQVERT